MIDKELPHDHVSDAFLDHDLAALLTSDHVQYVQSCRDLFSRAFFPLSDTEILALEANGNSGTVTLYRIESDVSVYVNLIPNFNCNFNFS